MSTAVRNVELLLEQLPREDRLGYFEELRAELQHAFWRELGTQVVEHHEAGRVGDRGRYDWHRRPRVGRLWNVPKYPYRPPLKVVQGGRQSNSLLEADVVRGIEPWRYVEALTGVRVPLGGYIRCPLPGHKDGTPSFKVYDSAEAGWFCFGCNRGGSVYDLASELWGMDPRRDFLKLRRRIAAALLGEVAA